MKGIWGDRFDLLFPKHKGRFKEYWQVTPMIISERLRSLFSCLSIIVAREKDKDGSQHWHVALLNKNATRYNATNRIRQEWKEWEGSQCWVSFHKAWGSLSYYVTKEDKQPFLRLGTVLPRTDWRGGTSKYEEEDGPPLLSGRNKPCPWTSSFGDYEYTRRGPAS